jgi:phage-related protein
MEQTTLAQGDFARTSGGLANQQRILGATFENVKATVGTALLPVVQQIASQMNAWLSDPAISNGLTNIATGIATFASNVISYIPQVISWFRQVGDWFMNNQGVIVAILAVLGVAVAAFGITTLAAIIPVVVAMLPLIAVMVLIGAAAYILYQAWTNNWGGIQEKTQAVLAFIKGIIQGALAAIQKFWADHGAQILASISAAWLAIQNIIGIAIGIIKQIFAIFQAAFSGDWYKFGELLRKAWDTAWNAIKTIFSNAWENLKTGVANLIKNVVNFFKTTDWGEVGKNIVKGIAEGITNAIDWVIKAVSGMARAIIAAIKGFLGIKSPSKVFEGLGILSGQGFALGLMKATGTVRIAGAGMAASAMGGVVNNSHVTNNLTVYSNSETASVVGDFGRMRAWARA